MKSQLSAPAAILVVACLVSVPGFPAEAQYFSFGQFHAFRNPDGYFDEVINPTGVEMYSMRIGYNEAGDFQGCEGDPIAPHANLQTTSGFGSTDVLEMLSVPSSAEAAAGQIATRFGVSPYQSDKTVHSLDPDVFEFDDTEGPTSVEGCVCDELCADGQNDDLLDAFGFDCDPCP